ncbi:MAG: DUF3109 family protein [Bacteroidetes bacterium]|uniref:DUF3109 family protein n=1 Tax=Candidatus Cryptobacteroides intestinavium TaxID=2840766 RepID=A0A9D9HII6_9BACT|nr:DUF3109 family protein [Candidatus Cryptobacteroides intestinavium]
MIQIGDCLVSSEILTEYFACDYARCKGCCCIIGDSGAPLEDGEQEKIERNYHIFSPLMREQGRCAVGEKGFFEIDADGDMVTPLVPGGEECAYTCFGEDGSCFCAMERMWFDGKGDFRKPASCWLYPIRVSVLGNGLRALNLHRWEICRDAFAKGRREGIRVFEFLEEPIVHCFGREFFQALKQCAEHPF